MGDGNWERGNQLPSPTIPKWIAAVMLMLSRRHLTVNPAGAIMIGHCHSTKRGKMADVEKTKEGTIVQQRPFEKFLAYMADRAVEESEEYLSHLSEDLSADQMDAILQAGTEEELLAAMKFAGLTGLRDLEMGTELEIYGFKFVKSNRPDISKRLGGYAVIDAIDMATGNALMLDTSIERIVACLRMFEHQGLFPKVVKVVKKSTGSGNEMITITWNPKKA